MILIDITPTARVKECRMFDGGDKSKLILGSAISALF